MSIDITSIPDYAALKQLATALWKENDSYFGAAIMVGAGFSRVAVHTASVSKKSPVWSDLSRILIEKMGGSGHTDALRLAEEYSAYFGRQALRDFLKKEINDIALVPGDMHKFLLELPWSEVLTTNWDTLLERASEEIHEPVYSIVNRQEDISSARAPRIVKLHGTISITEELVFTQEDYRKYPQHHAAFVNFARQVFIENELCLLGFSGDDPNFLQWAGWVRDHLGNHARCIYLVGALNLSASKRKYLESINVAPIDLYPLVAEYDDPDSQHKEATKFFINALQQLKPKPTWEWEPTQLQRATLANEEEIRKPYQDAAYAARLLERKIAILKEDRLAYPGWLTCPPSLLFRVQSQISDPYPTAKSLAAMTPDSRAKLLYEMVWRYRVTYGIARPEFVEELLAICDPDKPCSLTKQQQMEIALLLLKSSRWFDAPEAQSIAQATTVILEKNTKYWPECANELLYYRAIIARDQFDYLALENAAEKLDVVDPTWKIRKASLLAELGNFSEGENLIADAYRELLNQNRKDRNSIRVLSRLAWSQWLMRGIKYWAPGKEFKAFPSIYQTPKCNPWDHIEHIQGRITKTLEKQREQHGIEARFEPGTYKDNSKKLSFSNELSPFLLLDGIACTAGIPLRWSNIGFLIEDASKIAELDGLDDVYQFAFAIRSASSGTSNVLNKVFSRVQVARFSNNAVTWLFNRCNAALDYWSSRLADSSEDVRRFACDRLSVFMEILARVSVRIAPEQAKEIFKKGLALGETPAFHRPLLFDSLKKLIETPIKSVPEAHQHEMLMDALFFPLPAEIKVNNHHLDQWPNPIIQFPGSRSANAPLDRRIDEIIDRIAPCSPQSTPALLRLFPLLDAGFLTNAERQKIGKKIWGANPDYQLLPETGLLKHILFKFPAPDSSAARIAIRRHLFEAGDNCSLSEPFLLSIAYAAKMQGSSELPSPEQALVYFRKLVSWRAKTDDADPFRLIDQIENRLGDSIGKALAYAVVPVLPAEALDQENFNKLLAFEAGVDSPNAIIALSYFAANNDSFAEQVEKLIRQGLRGQIPNRVASSVSALLQWRELKASFRTDRLISNLVYLLGANLGGGLPALLWTVRQMYVKDYLSNDDIESLVECVPVVFDNSDYENISPSSQEAISISLVRVECVRLAKSILSKNQNESHELLRILGEAKRDPLPEVRFAEDTDG